MASKLSVAIVIAMFACCAQANLDKFGDLGTGEEGFYKRCFTKMSLGNLMRAYEKESAEDMLSADLNEVNGELDDQFGSFGGPFACSKFCYDKIAYRERASNLEGENELVTSRCQRYARFNRLCQLVTEQMADNLRLVSIGKWLCSTSKALERAEFFGYFKCQGVAGYPDVFNKEAEKELDSVLSYSFEELKQKQVEIAEEIEASNKLRRENDEKFVIEAYSKVNEGIEQLPEYIECSKKEVRDDAHEAEVRAKMAMEEKRDADRWQKESDHEDELKQKEADKAPLVLFALSALGG